VDVGGAGREQHVPLRRLAAADVVGAARGIDGWGRGRVFEDVVKVCAAATPARLAQVTGSPAAVVPVAAVGTVRGVRRGVDLAADQMPTHSSRRRWAGWPRTSLHARHRVARVGDWHRGVHPRACAGASSLGPIRPIQSGWHGR